MARPKRSNSFKAHQAHQASLFGGVRTFFSSWVEYFHKHKLQDETQALSEFVGHVLEYMYCHVSNAVKELVQEHSVKRSLSPPPSPSQGFDSVFDSSETLSQCHSFVDMEFTETILGEFEPRRRKQNQFHFDFIHYVHEMFESTDATAACLIIGLRYMDRVLAEILGDAEKAQAHADGTLVIQSPCSSYHAMSPISSRSDLHFSASTEDLVGDMQATIDEGNYANDDDLQNEPLKESSMDILKQMFKTPLKFATWFSVCVMLAAKVHTDRKIKNSEWRDKIATEALMGMSTVLVRQVSHMELVVILNCNYRLHVRRDEYFRFVQHCYQSCPGLKATYHDALSDFCYSPSTSSTR